MPSILRCRCTTYEYDFYYHIGVLLVSFGHQWSSEVSPFGEEAGLKSRVMFILLFWYPGRKRNKSVSCRRRESKITTLGYPQRGMTRRGVQKEKVVGGVFSRRHFWAVGNGRRHGCTGYCLASELGWFHHWFLAAEQPGGCFSCWLIFYDDADFRGHFLL